MCLYIYSVCVPWCMHGGQRTALWSLFSLSCLHTSMFANILPLILLLSLSFKKKGPTDHPGEHLKSLVQLHTSVQPPWRPTPALHTYTTAHTSPCYSEASTGHTCKGSTQHLPYKGVLLSEPGPASGPCTQAELCCFSFLHCFSTSLAPWGLGRMRPQLSL